MKWTYGLVNRLVRLCDVILLLVSIGIGWSMRLIDIGDSSGAILVAIIGGFVFINTVELLGGYRIENYRHRGAQFLHLLLATTAGGSAMALVVWLFADFSLIRAEGLLLWLLGTLALVWAGRMLVRLWLRRLHKQGAFRRDVIIVGATEIAEQIIQNIQSPQWRERFRVIAVFDDRIGRLKDGRIAGMPIQGDIAALRDYIHTVEADLIAIALPWEAAGRVFDLLERLQMISADIVLPIRPNRLNLRLPQGSDLAGMPVLQLMREPLKGSMALVKLALDYSVGLVGMVVALPILAVAAIAIKLDSPGPILFRQPRLGLNNKPFMIYKLRTMAVDPGDDGTKGTSRNDPRITKVGNFLRRSSIDELPQLINVLRGEMSVVGPRAHVPNMLVSDAPYAEAVRRYAMRSRIKPGITGWAQINGMRGGINTLEKAQRGVDLDSYYVENWSVWFDLKIMMRTLTVGMAGRNVF
ncbi:MAG: exopolysaccharide biosynthesis polyprenyl glycosylphosphotransferase [Alphaproteobacteria bacterium]|nr:exopolysaccharide biosynthesis polyprenyl glycosylphosphotransferase [Alphaproteobacteria bacterium]